MKWIKRYEKLDTDTYKSAGKKLKHIGKYERGQKLIDHADKKTHGVFNFWVVFRADLGSSYSSFVYNSDDKMSKSAQEKIQELEFSNPSCKLELYGDNKTVESLIQSWSEGKCELGFNLQFSFSPMLSAQNAHSSTKYHGLNKSDKRVNLFEIAFTIAAPVSQQEEDLTVFDKYERNSWNTINLVPPSFSSNHFYGIFSDRKSAFKFKNGFYKKLMEEKYYDQIYDIFSALGADVKDFERFIYGAKNLRTNFLYDDELRREMSKSYKKDVSDMNPQRRWFDKDMSGVKPKVTKQKTEGKKDQINELFDYKDKRKMNHIRNYDFIEQKDMIITVDQVLKIHDDTIENHGGIYGIRDEDQLESAILKPYTSAFGQDIYPTFFNKVASILEALARLHPFADGNKRTAWGSMEWALSNKGYKLNIQYDEGREIIVKIINDDIDNDEVSKWLEDNSNNNI